MLELTQELSATFSAEMRQSQGSRDGSEEAGLYSGPQGAGRMMKEGGRHAAFSGDLILCSSRMGTSLSSWLKPSEGHQNQGAQLLISPFRESRL